MQSFTSRPGGNDALGDTLRHIEAVKVLIAECVSELMKRGLEHDASKLQEPEWSSFEKNTALLKNMKFGSAEYEAVKASMKPALDHHYANNRHHPEHFENRCSGMNLIDLLEMVCDWKASNVRSPDTKLEDSVELLQKRFGYGDEVKWLILNTCRFLQERYPQDTLRSLYGPQKP